MLGLLRAPDLPLQNLSHSKNLRMTTVSTAENGRDLRIRKKVRLMSKTIWTTRMSSKPLGLESWDLGSSARRMKMTGGN
jgi:hypothetical protein